MAVKLGRFSLSGRVVSRRFNHHIVKVLEPTRKLTCEEAEQRVKELLKGS